MFTPALKVNRAVNTISSKPNTAFLQLANWLESYAESLELAVWTSSTVTKASQDTSSGKWIVDVVDHLGRQRTFKVNHVVFATGQGGTTPHLPSYPGMVSNLNASIQLTEKDVRTSSE